MLTLKPDGPHAVPLGKVRRVAAILKVGGSWIAGIEVGTLGMVGGMAYGCLDFNNSNIVSLFGAMPWDVKI